LVGPCFSPFPFIDRRAVEQRNKLSGA
jgi:hypothetical protein